VDGKGASGRHRAPEETRRRLVDAAQSLFAEQGYAATSIQQICRRAAVSVGSFYLHFEDKAAVATTVLDRTHQRFASTLTALDIGRPNAVESAVNGLLEGPEAAIYRSLREAAEVEPGFAVAAGVYRAAVHGQLTATLKAARADADEEYVLDAQSLAWTVLALLREAVSGRGQLSARVIATVISCTATARVRSGGWRLDSDRRPRPVA
jgi:AcrR family transcriptional regulator